MEGVLSLADAAGLGPDVATVLVCVFARMSGFIFFVPGLSERVVPTQVRLAGAIALSLLTVPSVLAGGVAAPQSASALLATIAAEAVNGLLLGFGLRVVLFALQVAGAFVSQSMSVAQGFIASLTFDLDTMTGTLLVLAGTAVLMATELHVYVVGLFIASYGGLPFGTFPIGEGLASFAIEKTAWSIHFGVALALPFIVVSFIYNAALGALNRAMPQLMVAFVGAPAMMAVGVAGIALAAPLMIGHWRDETGVLYAEILETFR